jgi:hypothetical protein
MTNAIIIVMNQTSGSGKRSTQCLGKLPTSQNVQQRTDDGMQQAELSGVRVNSHNVIVSALKLWIEFTEDHRQGN